MDLVSELRLFGEDLVSGPCYNPNAATIGRAADAFVRLQAELRSRCPPSPAIDPAARRSAGFLKARSARAWPRKTRCEKEVL